MTAAEIAAVDLNKMTSLDPIKKLIDWMLVWLSVWS